MLTPDMMNMFPGDPKSIAHISVEYKHKIDAEFIATLNNAHKTFLESVKAIGIEKFVIGLSGGVDSVVACALLKSSAVPVTAIIVEIDHGNELSEETRFAISIAQKLNIDYRIVHADQIYKEHLKLFPDASQMARVHLRSRLINSIIFQFADQHSGFVVDTTDKSEDILKIYEESFRGHFVPVIDFYKSEMYDIADYFGLAEMRQRRSGCPELTDFDAFGVDWEDLDPILYLLAERGESGESIARDHAIDWDWLKKLERRIALQSLRTSPTILRVPRPTH